MPKPKAKIDPPAEPENEAEQDDTEPTQESGPAAGDMRIKFRIPDNGAKVFTSDGPKLHGAVCDLPADEAQGYCDRDLAHPTDQDLNGGPAAKYVPGPQSG